MSGIKVVNAGEPGEETSQSVERISEVLEQYHPKLVIVCLGGNDMLRKRSFDTIKINLKQIIEAIQVSGTQAVLVAVPAPSIRLKAPDFYEELGDELRVPVNDNAIAKLMSEPQYKSDSIHFNQQGYQLLAMDINKFLRQHGAY